MYNKMQRKLISEILKEVLLVSRYITLYLVDSKPPNFFTFVDPLNNFFKVCIDKKISCSCQPGNNDHCMHTFYVLIKIYHISEEDPLIFQKEYSEGQLKKIFSGEHSKNWTGSKEQREIENEEKKVEYFDKKEKKEEVSKLDREEKKYAIVNAVPQPTISSEKNITPIQKIQKTIEKIEYEQPQLEKGSCCSICY